MRANLATHFIRRHQRRPDCDAGRLHARAGGRIRRGLARGRPPRICGIFSKSIVPVIDRVGLAVLGKDESHPRARAWKRSALRVSFEQAGRMRFDAVALQKYPQVERIRHIHTAGNSSGIVDGAAAVLIGSGRARWD
jgi:acetyl-CoA C-acetyltransferase